MYITCRYFTTGQGNTIALLPMASLTHELIKSFQVKVKVKGGH